jgi:hypothetical protein
LPRSRVSERQLAAECVADHADWYRQDKNPLRAWLAYRECRRHRLRIPTWTLEYFDRAADELAQLAAQIAPARSPAVMKALGMTRARGTIFTQFKASDLDLSLASLYVARRALKAKQVRRDAVGRRVSRSTMHLALKRATSAGFNTGRLIGK